LWMNAVYKHLDTSKWCGFLSGKALIHPETCNRVVILKSSIYQLVNTPGQWAIHCNQEILWNLNPLLRSLQIWIHDNLQNVSEPYLTKVDIIWMCLDACKLHSSTKWPIPTSFGYGFLYSAPSGQHLAVDHKNVKLCHSHSHKPYQKLWSRNLAADWSCPFIITLTPLWSHTAEFNRKDECTGPGYSGSPSILPDASLD
jgi:hypothetical protein